MSDYTDILALLAEQRMKEGNILGNTTGTVQAPADSLTLEKIRDMMARLPSIPPSPKIDLYGHDLNDQEQAYVLDRKKMAEQMYPGRSSWMRRYIVGADQDRQMVIVPRARLRETFQQLKEAGLDVRLEPRYSAPAPRESRFPPATKPKEPDADGDQTDR